MLILRLLPVALLALVLFIGSAGSVRAQPIVVIGDLLIPQGGDVSGSFFGGLASPGGVELTFSTVTVGGTVTVAKSTVGPPPPAGLRIVGTGGEPLYYDITTNATFTGLVTVCIAYDETDVVGSKAGLEMILGEPLSGFDDQPLITVTVDDINDIVCGETLTFSIFAVAEPLPVGGIVELVSGPADSNQKVQQSGQGHELEVAALAIVLAAVAAVSWHRYRRRAA